MGAVTDIWRTRLGKALVAWMVLCVVLILALGPVGELLAELPVTGAVTILILLPGVVLAGWCLVATARRPTSAWPTFPLLVAYGAALWFGGETILLAGARSYFELRQDTYERIIAEAQAGRLPSEGRRYGVTYSVWDSGYPAAAFPWGTVSWGFFGIRYDEYTCHDRELPQALAPRPSLGSDDPPPEAPTLKSRRFLNGYYRPFSERACLVYEVG